MTKIILLPVLAGIAISTLSFSCIAKSEPDNNLKVVMIRHGEKPDSGDNLSCQGENRALQLPAVLYKKFNIPNYTYIPELKSGNATKHSRMFQTVSPFAIKYNLTIDSQYKEDSYSKVADDVKKKSGTVLMVWEHKAIQPIAEQLGVENPPAWKSDDFDSIWIITYQNGKASLAFDQEGITPSSICNF
ncbi:MAG: histidine phosphatase family protein [Gammaproteobacteria bacterium]